MTLPRVHGILGPHYFAAAIARAQGVLGAQGAQGAPVVIFSDEPEWCAQQAFARDALLVDEPVDVDALWLLTRFRRYVISNGSFSWWGAFLGAPAELVVAPERWFGPDGPQDDMDINLPNWVTMPI